MSKKVRKKVNKILKKQLTGVSLFFAVLFLIIGIVIGFYLYNINNKEGFSKIELNGNGIVNLKVGDNYNEEGFTMVIDDYDYADMVLVNGKAKIMEVELADPDLLTKYIDDSNVKSNVIKTFAKKIEGRVR